MRVGIQMPLPATTGLPGLSSVGLAQNLKRLTRSPLFVP
jgi:hypothetical protein